MSLRQKRENGTENVAYTPYFFDGISSDLYNTDWNHLPEGAIGTSHGKTHIFKTRVRKVKTREGK